MKRRTIRRGQPLVAFAVMLGGWALARYAAWTLLGSDPFVHEPVAAGTPVPAVRQVHKEVTALADRPNSGVGVRFISPTPAANPAPQFAPVPGASPLPQLSPMQPELAPPPVATLPPKPATAADEAVVAMGGHCSGWPQSAGCHCLPKWRGRWQQPRLPRRRRQSRRRRSRGRSRWPTAGRLMAGFCCATIPARPDLRPLAAPTGQVRLAPCCAFGSTGHRRTGPAPICA